MADKTLHVLLVEDSQIDDAALIVRLLEKSGQTVRWERVETAADLRAALDARPWDVIISDYNLPELDAPAALAILQQAQRDIPFIVVSGMIGEETAVMMMREGAKDYMMKHDLARLVPAVVREVADARARQRARETEEQVRQMRAMQSDILNALGTPIALIGPDGVIVTVNEAWRRFAIAGGLLNPGFGVGTNYLEVCDRVTGEEASQARAAATGIREVLDGRKCEFALEYPCHAPGEKRWFRLVSTPLRVDDRAGAVVMHINITERNRAEELLRQSESHFRQTAAYNQRLVQEVNHRVRNNLAALLSVIALTRRRAGDLPSFAAAIDMRVRSLARVHNLMASTNWQGMDLAKMIGLCEVTQPDGQFSGRVVIDGPSVYLGSGQILPLASSLVEMFNNSVKYGALSAANGTVAIRWSVKKDSTGWMVTLRWIESNGPAIVGPTKPSLGTELIEGFVTHDLNGKCTLSYPPTGAHHVFEFLALDAVAAESA